MKKEVFFGGGDRAVIVKRDIQSRNWDISKRSTALQLMIDASIASPWTSAYEKYLIPARFFSCSLFYASLKFFIVESSRRVMHRVFRNTNFENFERGHLSLDLKICQEPFFLWYWLITSFSSDFYRSDPTRIRWIFFPISTNLDGKIIFQSQSLRVWIKSDYGSSQKVDQVF